MTQAASNRGRFEDQGAIKTISVHFEDANFPVDSTTEQVSVPVLKFPANGRIVSANLIPHGTVAAGTVNYSVGLYNGLQADPPAGTISVAAVVGGADGATAQRPVAMTIATVDDHDLFAKGDWLMLNVQSNGDPAMDFSVAVDYALYGD